MEVEGALKETDVLMEYAKERARWWASKHPNLADDIMGTSMLAFVRAMKKDPEYPKAFISRYIDNAMADLINRNDLIYIPRRHKRRLQAADKSLDDLPKAIATDPLELTPKAKRIPAWVMLHLEDVMTLLKLSDYERKIVELRRDEFTFEEIGEKLNRTAPTIHHALDNIARRYRTMVKQHPEILKPNDET